MTELFHRPGGAEVFDRHTGMVRLSDGETISRREFELHHEDRKPVVPQGVGGLSRLLLSARGLKTRGNFARDFLPRVGAPTTTQTLVAMMAWMQAEGDAAQFNPINTTHDEPGSWDFNWVHVQNYDSYADGVRATAETLNYGADRNMYGYDVIRRRLRDNGRAGGILAAVESSAWGTGGLASQVLQIEGWENLLKNRFLHHRLVQ